MKREKLKITIALIQLLLVGVATAMPPQPEAWRALNRDQRDLVDQVRNDALGRGLDQRPGVRLANPNNELHRDDENQVTLRLPVILIEFADNLGNHETHSREYYENILFSEDQFQTGSVRDYYFENSFEQVVITGEVVGWYRAPQTYAYYTNRQYGLGNYPRNAQRLAEDAIRAADGDTDFSQFDNDDDGIVDAPFIIHAGGGAEQNPNDVNQIWSHAWNVEALGQLDGVRFDGYTIVPEDGNIGVFSHELGHALFGLPDLYDTGGESAGLGYWSVMSYGAWGDGGRRPVQFDSWCKEKLGWIELESLEFDRRATLPPAESSGRAFKLWNPENPGPQYFLAEYRDKSGFDGELPAAGLLIYHVDEAMANNDHPFFPGNQGNQHDLIALEQADNDYDLEQFENPGDTGDPYPGSSDNHTFDLESHPGSISYTGGETGVAVRNIEITEAGIQADWYVGVDGPPLVEQQLSLREGWNLISFRVTPPSPSLVEIVSPLVENNRLRFVKDASGRFYAPDRGFNNIPFWDVNSGYLLQLTENTEFVIEGEEIEFDREIPLRAGWQAVAYFPDARMSVERAFADVVDSLVIVKDDNGRFYLPRNRFSNMDRLMPGKGYLLKLSGEATHRYPER